MISSLAWVKKGAAARHPSKFIISDDAELQRIQKLTNLEFGDAQGQLKEARQAGLGNECEDAEWQDEEGEDADESGQKQSSEEQAQDDQVDVEMDEDDLAKYKLDTYDDEESTGIAMGAFSNIKGLSFYKSNEDDPYITLKDDKEEEDEDREALEVLPTDNLLISAKTEDEVSLLEAHVYESVSDDSLEGFSLYVHHDLLLPSFPLCLEWVGHTPASAASSFSQQRKGHGNFLAVTTMEPEVEIWNVDVIDGLVPDVVLGDRKAKRDWEKDAGKRTGKKKRKIPALRPRSPHYHTDSVLSVSWNPFVPSLLISSSADGTIKLWNIDAKPAQHGGLEAMRSFEVHDDKVQSVAWNTSGVSLGAREGGEQHRSVVASGGYDSKVKVFDVRLPSAVTSITVAGEIEKIRWNPWRRENLIVSLDTGLVVSYDVDASQLGRVEAKSLWTLSAHESACTSVDVSPHLPGCIVTAGLDRQVKLWNIEGTDGKPKQITLVSARDLGAGKVFAAAFSPDDVLTVAAAGSSGSVKVWDALNAKGVADVFSTRLKKYLTKAGSTRREPNRNATDTVVEVEQDEDEFEDEDEDRGEAGVTQAREEPNHTMDE